MEYIRISESKLKVMLERKDLEEWDISADRLDYSDPDAKRVFGDILCHAKRELGFDTAGRRILLQLYPSRDGGCELFISCSELPAGANNEHDSEETGKKRAYSFSSLEDLLAVCKRLLGRCGFCDSSVWFDENGRWYLLFTELGTSPELDMLPLNPLSFICEYGESESYTALSLYLGEYARPVCEGNAIERLGTL